MDAKLSCIVKGLLGVIFGALALFVPQLTRTTFLAIFWVLVGAGLVICIFLAITSHHEGSLFWFMLASVFVIIGICSLIFQTFVALIFIVAIAALAFYSGLSGITLALTQPKSKYYLLGGTFVAAVILLLFLLKYAPTTQNDLVLTILGVFALVFGFFSIVMGWYFGSHPVVEPVVNVPTTCSLPKKEE